MATVTSTSPSKYAGKSIKTLSDGSKVRVDSSTGKSGTGGSHSIDTTSKAGLDNFANEIAGGAVNFPGKIQESPMENAAAMQPTSIAEQTAAIQKSALPTPTTPDQISGAARTQALSNIEQQAGQVQTGIDDLSAQYKNALSTVKGSGVAPAQGAGAGMAGVQQGLGITQPQKPEAPSMLGAIMDTDSNFDSIFTQFDEFYSPVKQKDSLLKEYKKMEKSLGIESMNDELLDAKRIIEGTESDVRAEVTAVGGFATESQVQALANARNKSLIKNYNYLLESRDSAMTQLSTYMNLSIQDRQMAEAEFDRKMGYATKIMEFQQRATDNAKSNYNNIVSKVGYKGLLAATNGNVYEQSLIEKTLGLGSGGLSNLANLPEDPDVALDREYKRAQISNIYSQIGGRGTTSSGGTSNGIVDSNGKPIKLTATQVDSLVGFDNTLAGAQKAQDLLEQGVKTGPLQNLKLQGAKVLDRADENQLDMEQTLSKMKADFMKSISGAAVSESEAKRLAKFLPELGDQESVIKSKLKNLIEESNKSKANYLKTLGVSGGLGNTVVAPDGNEYMIID